MRGSAGIKRSSEVGAKADGCVQAAGVFLLISVFAMRNLSLKFIFKFSDGFCG